MRTALSVLLFLAGVGLFLVEGLFLCLALLFEKLGKFFRWVAWRLGVLSNLLDEWNEPGK
jgi:hypothetical protein